MNSSIRCFGLMLAAALRWFVLLQERLPAGGLFVVIVIVMLLLLVCYCYW